MDGEAKLPDKFAFIGSSHITNVASSVLLCHKNVQKIRARNDGLEFDDSEPDVRIVACQATLPPLRGRDRLLDAQQMQGPVQLEALPIQSQSIWRTNGSTSASLQVSEGHRNRWFFDEGDARQYARDRYDDVEGSIPFVKSIDAVEMLSRLNELEVRYENVHEMR